MKHDISRTADALEPGVLPRLTPPLYDFAPRDRTLEVEHLRDRLRADARARRRPAGNFGPTVAVIIGAAAAIVGLALLAG